MIRRTGTVDFDQSYLRFNLFAFYKRVTLARIYITSHKRPVTLEQKKKFLEP